MLIVEDGSGVTDANSLVTVAEADDFLSMFDVTDCWCGGLDKKEKWLKLANYKMMSLSWVGDLVSANQKTPFPRDCAYNICRDCCDTDYRIDTDEIPNEVKEAQMLIALGLASGEIKAFGSKQNSGIVSSVSLDDISVSFEDGKGIAYEDLNVTGCDKSKERCDPLPQIKALLTCFLSTRNKYAKSMRVVVA